MEVTVEPFIGKSMRTNPDGSERLVRFDQYRVRVDGMHAGYIGTQKGAKLMLTTKFTPMEADEISEKVAEIIKQEKTAPNIVPDVPAELLNPSSESEDLDDIYDDFDS